jgi:hypothetical protein
VAAFVAEQREAHPDRVLVYVGASWCEPCRYFHEALTAGRLDDVLGGMRVIEYDLDRHKQALVDAGYQSRLIPLFALPNPDGTASNRTFSGSIKGPDSVDQNIAPRLRTLLSARTQP